MDWIGGDEEDEPKKTLLTTFVCVRIRQHTWTTFPKKQEEVVEKYMCICLCVYIIFRSLCVLCRNI